MEADTWVIDVTNAGGSSYVATSFCIDDKHYEAAAEKEMTLPLMRE